MSPRAYLPVPAVAAQQGELYLHNTLSYKPQQILFDVSAASARANILPMLLVASLLPDSFETFETLVKAIATDNFPGPC